MSIPKFVGFSVVVFLLYFVQKSLTLQDGNDKQQEGVCQCPPIVPRLNLSDIGTVKIFHINLANALWSKMKLSEEGNELKNLMLDLIKSDDASWKGIAFTCVVCSWLNYNKADNVRNICPYAKLINATIPWQTNNNCSLMSTAIEDLILSMTSGIKSVISTGLKNTECESRKVKPDPPNCYKNGTVYDIKEIWDLNGRNLPSKLRDITMRLFKSNDYVDELLAVITTASLTLPLRLSMIHFDPNVLYGILCGALSPKLSKCCCPAYIDYMDVYQKISESATGLYTVVTKEVLKCA